MVDLEWLKKNLLLVSGTVAGLVLVGLGIWLTIPHPQETKIAIESAASGDNQKELTVDVSGAVLHPGVYSLESDARITDALSAAGGVTGEADAAWVDKNINRAAKVADGAKIYIPFVGDKALTAPVSGIVAGVSSRVISVNLATQAELESLPGVGPATATKIINGRPYQNLEDLVSKKVLGQSLFDKIKDRLGL